MGRQHSLMALQDPKGSRFRALAWPVFAAHGVMGFLGIAFWSSIEPDSWFWLGALCLASLVSLGWLVMRSVASCPQSVMYETGIFLALSSGVYFGFGPLLHAFNPLNARETANLWFEVNGAEAVFLTGINYLGLGIAGLSYTAFQIPRFAALASRMSVHWAVVGPTTVFWGFLLVGAVFKFWLLWPFQLGLTDTVQGSFVYALSGLLAISLFIAARYWKSLGAIGRVAAVLAMVLQVVAGMLAYNKTDVMLPLVAFSLGGFLAHPRKHRALVAAAVLFLGYVLITPPVNFARIETAKAQAVAAQRVSIQERFDLLVQFYQIDHHVIQTSGQSLAWWIRLNYLPSQNAAVYFQRVGDGSDDLDRMLWIFIPRVIYPDKPQMTGAGIRLTEKIAGHESSSTGIGIFVDGYYLLGWFGVLFTSMSYGLVLRAYTSIARPVVEEESTIMLPLVFMGIFLGMRADGWWLTDVVGAAVIATGILGLLWVFRVSRHSFQGS